MIFLKSKKVDVNMKFVDELVRGYFSCLKENSISLNCSEVSELLRYSVCKLLGLQSKGYNDKIEEMSKLVVNSLQGVVSRYSINDMTEEYKTGILEACVHCMEMSRKKVLN